MKEIDYRKLARYIVNEQSSEFLSFDDVCYVLGYSKGSSPVRRIIEREDFPKATELVESGRRRWFKKDVMDWIEKQRANRSKSALIASQAV